MTEERLNRVMYLVLVTGMVASLIIILLGLGVYVIDPPTSDGPVPSGELPDRLMAGDPIAIIELGILVLIATPLVRVLAALTMFARQKDVRFVMISLIVLSVIILASLLDF
ncbi:MAG TPA: DUF1634 domain-containing protein [Methanomassiliicoccales archaeon]|nr:DUF1634 domain-containing protein [Methanomassiliicoccales archaeon]